METLKKFLIEGLTVWYALILLIFSLATVGWVAYSPKLREFVTDEGKLSMGRLLCLMVAVFYLASIAFVAFEKGTITDFPTIAAGLIAALYGINKFSPSLPGGSK